MFIGVSRIKFAFLSVSLGILLLGASTAARADVMAYFENTLGQFGTIDLTNGNINIIGTNGTVTNGLASYVNGFGVANGQLYATSYTAASNEGTLYSINTVTGAATPIGSTGVSGEGYSILGSTSNGLFTILPVGGASTLESISTITGAPTGIGPIGVEFGPFPIFSTSSDPGSLYEIGAGGGASSRYFGTINTSTGAGTVVGESLVAVGWPAMMDTNGTLYAILQQGDGVLEAYTIDPTTGIETPYGTWTTTLSELGYDFTALAPDPLTSSVPEPAAILFLAPVLAGLIGFKRKYIG